MSDDLKNQEQTTGVETASSASAQTHPSASANSKASSRRRLLRRGVAVAPIALTLASRPVLAWHCKSPSAWGSEIINPNTSLKGNDGHATYVDETWTINNWKTNTPRTGSGLEDDGVTGQPWSELLSVCPGLMNDQTKTRITGTNTFFFDFRKARVRHLVQNVPGFVNPGFGDNKLITSIPSGDPKTYALVAQLNYVVLKQVKFNNDIDKCINGPELQQMARGTYLENGSPWGLEKAKQYFYNNWIVRP